MAKRLKSMDVSIAGTTRSFEFDPPVPVDSDDDGEASLELLRDAETTEVVLVDAGIASARVTIRFSVSYESEVEIDLEDLEGIDDQDDLVYQVEMGNFSVVYDTVNDDVTDNITQGDYITIDSVDVEECFDEDGNTIDY